MNREYIPLLTPLRGLAALLILLVHYSPFFPVLKEMGLPTQNHLWVNFFFVVSGFVIALGYSQYFASGFNKPAYKEFIWRRFIRIYPLHAAALLAMAVVECYRIFVYHSMNTEMVAPVFNWDMDAEKGMPAMLYNLLLVQSWGLHKWVGWNSPAWTVSAEWFAYLLFPVLLMIVSKLRSTIVALGTLFALYVLMVAIDTPGNSYNFTLLHAAIGFMTGIALCRAYQRGESRFDKYLTNSKLLIVVLLLCVFYRAVFSFDYLALPLFSVLVYGATKAQGKFAQWLSNRPLEYLGHISYSLYITHFVMLNLLDLLMLGFFNRYTNSLPVLQSQGAFIVFFAITVFVADRCHRYFEQRLPQKYVGPHAA